MLLVLPLVAVSVLAALGFAQAPKAGPALLVSLSGDARVVLIDPDSGRQLKAFTVMSGPHEIALDRAGRLAYVATPGSPAEGSSTVSAIDLSSDSAVRHLDVAPRRQPHDVRVSADGSLVWVACAPDRAVVEMDAASGAVRRTWDVGADGGWFVAATPDDRKLYVPHLEGKKLTRVDRRSGDVSVVLEGGAQSGIDVSPDGREVWVIAHDQKQVAVVATDSDRVIARIDLPAGEFGRLRFTPDGRRVLVVQGKRLMAFDAGTRVPAGALDMPLDGKVIAISPDSRRAALSNPTDGRVTIVDLAAMKVAGSHEVGRMPDGVAWVSR